MSQQPERVRRAQARVLLAGLPLVAVVMLGSAGLIYHQPVTQTWQLVGYLLVAAICLGLLPPTWQAVRREDRLRLAKIGLVLFQMLFLIVLVRIVSLLFDVAVRAPNLSLFRPAFTFLPCLYLGAMLLLGTRLALAASWAIWAVVVALVGVAMWVNDWTLSRNGLQELTVWLLLGNPLFLVAMHALPNLEDALHRAQEEIHELRGRSELLERVSASEQRFNRVVDSLQVGVWDQQFVGGELSARWWSPRFCALLGYEPHELGAGIPDMELLLGDRAHTIREPLYLQLREKGMASFDACLRTKHQDWRWFNIACKAEFDEQNRFTRITGALEDIHLRRVAEEELRAAQAELMGMAYHDALTGLPNRRAFDDQLRREWERARRGGQPLSLLAIDIDWFKNYNDHYGHPAGDECLRQVAKSLTNCTRRPGDFASRVGGEEFHVLAPETTAEGAHKVAMLIQSSLREQALPHLASPLGVVSCSIGISTVKVSADITTAQFIELADANLYESKRSGRARVTQSAAQPL